MTADEKKLKELFDAWDLYHSPISNKDLLKNSLDPDVRELLEIAIIQQKLLPLQVGLGVTNINQTFYDYLHEIGEENLIWFCDVFINLDGSLSEDLTNNQIYLCFVEFCNKKNIDSDEIIHTYKNKIKNFDFYPIYDQIFKRELNSIGDVDTTIAIKSNENEGSNLQGFEKMWFHLGSLGKTLLGGSLLLVAVGLFTSLAKIGTYLTR
jgi:hypothetical protein